MLCNTQIVSAFSIPISQVSLHEHINALICLSLIGMPTYHSYDIQLAFISQPSVAPQSFSAYCTELQLLQTQKAKYTEAQDEEELLTYVATTLGKKNPITRGLYQPGE